MQAHCNCAEHRANLRDGSWKSAIAGGLLIVLIAVGILLVWA